MSTLRTEGSFIMFNKIGNTDLPALVLNNAKKKDSSLILFFNNLGTRENNLVASSKKHLLRDKSVEQQD